MPDPKNPKPGELHIDASNLASFFVDLPPGAMRGMRTEQDDYGDVVKEILANQTQWGDKAGVTAADVQSLTTADERIAQIDVYLGSALKLAEVLTETRAKLDDERQRLVGAIAESVERRAKVTGGPELLAKYETTRAYRSAAARKGVKTREASQEAKAGEGAAEPPK